MFLKLLDTFDWKWVRPRQRLKTRARTQLTSRGRCCSAPRPARLGPSSPLPRAKEVAEDPNWTAEAMNDFILILL